MKRLDEMPKKRDRTRDQLLEAALRVIARRDIGEVSIREIAAEALVANGTFYNYFRTKDEIVAALSARLAADFADALTALDIVDPAERAAIAIRSLISNALADPNLGWALVRITESGRAQHLVDCFLQDLRAGIICGRFAVSCELAAIDLAFGATLSAMRAVLGARAGAGHDIATTELVLRGLGVPSAEAHDITRRPLPPVFIRVGQSA